MLAHRQGIKGSMRNLLNKGLFSLYYRALPVGKVTLENWRSGLCHLISPSMMLGGKKQFYFDRNVPLIGWFLWRFGGEGGGKVMGKERSPLKYATANDSAT